MNTDLTFITNEGNESLKNRFEVLVRDTEYFDCLVGFFYTSGFYSIFPSLETSRRIRILVGISTNRETLELINKGSENRQLSLEFSHSETKEIVEESIRTEFEESEDKANVEVGIRKFVEWIKSGKLEIRAYPSQNIHAKLYIMTFRKGDRDSGRVITGSSNFTRSGLSENLEFNVELKTRSDYEFAKNKFEELWKVAVDVSEKYVETIEKRTWLNQTITPYELFLKFLYEYFKEELNQPEEIFARYFPEDFKKLVYQEEAVLNAKKILEEYGGVFISDVVGLGKTYVGTMLAGQLDGRTLVIAPPALLDKDNPGSWRNAFMDFRVPADFESIGKLEDIITRGTERFKNVIIDEAHRFRNESNKTYEKLAEICRGKRIILVTATPYNNTPEDILAQIKLFQNVRRSTIPNLPDLESFFRKLGRSIKGIDRHREFGEYLRITKEIAREIREKVLKYLMVRRTRSEITRYYTKDTFEQGVKFPNVEDPKPLYYELDNEEDRIFNETIRLISKEFGYARYTPLLYYKGKLDQLAKQSQRNMGKFMKILLVKRLESSFFAFKNSISRFIRSYNLFIEEYENGSVYVSAKHTQKIFELLEEGDHEAIQKLIDSNKAERYDSSQFKSEFIQILRKDLEILKEIDYMWKKIRRDPKLLSFIRELAENEILQTGKLIIFTESKETAEYLSREIRSRTNETTLVFTGASAENIRDKVIDNFDAKSRHRKDDYRILIATEVLSEGVNLHRSNVVLNYDIPWNPTRLMQRVGRINRIDTPFETIHTFNFFPSKQANDEIRLSEAAQAKINAFLTLLGGDAALLTEGEPIGSHELFERLSSKSTITGDDEGESELKYLQIIKKIRDDDPPLFERIKQLPKKARSSKLIGDMGADHDEFDSSLLSFFRLGKLQKFFVCFHSENSRELDFISAAKLLESSQKDERKKLPSNYYDLLDLNKQAFYEATTVGDVDLVSRRGRDGTKTLIDVLKATLKNGSKLTDEQEEYVRKVISKLSEGALPKQTIKEVNRALEEITSEIKNALKVVAILQLHLPQRLLESHYAERTLGRTGKREVILSMYLSGGRDG